VQVATGESRCPRRSISPGAVAHRSSSTLRPTEHLAATISRCTSTTSSADAGQSISPRPCQTWTRHESRRAASALAPRSPPPFPASTTGRIAAFALKSGRGHPHRLRPHLLQVARRSEARAYVAKISVVDPVRWVGRATRAATLIQNGTRDSLTPRPDVLALYTAARKPKELRWYPAGHDLNAAATEYLAQWLLRRLRRLNEEVMNAEFRALPDHEHESWRIVGRSRVSIAPPRATWTLNRSRPHGRAFANAA